MSVKSSKTGRLSYFTGPDAGDGSFAQKIAIASYNAGRWPSYAVSINRDPDTYTTGKDYSADVLARAKVFRELLANDSAVASLSSEQQAVKPTVDPQTPASSTADLPPIHVETVENVKIDQTPPPQEKPVVVSIERTSVWSKIGAGFAALTGLGISLGSVITEKLNSLEPRHFLYVLGGVVLIALALYFFDKAQARAHAKTIEKMRSAADPASNTVDLTRAKQ
jgi:hypothetical protein